MSATSYNLPRCVVLLAAVFGTRKAYEWAMEVLPLARAAENMDRDDTHDEEYRREARDAMRRFYDMRDGGVSEEEEQ